MAGSAAAGDLFWRESSVGKGSADASFAAAGVAGFTAPGAGVTAPWVAGLAAPGAAGLTVPEVEELVPEGVTFQQSPESESEGHPLHISETDESPCLKISASGSLPASPHDDGPVVLCPSDSGGEGEFHGGLSVRGTKSEDGSNDTSAA